MIDVGGLEKVTGKLIAWLRDRGRDGWWVIVCPAKDGKAASNEYVEYGPFTFRQAQCRIIGIKKELADAGWIEGP